MSRTILITGASGKLGRKLVTHFLDQGDAVVGTSRNAATLAELFGAHKSFTGIAVDLSRTDGVSQLLSQLSKHGIRPDCLVNNARTLNHLKVGPDGTVSRENFLGEFLLDVVVPYELTVGLAAQPGSKLVYVVNMGSQYGTVAANPHLYEDPTRQSPLHYGVAKAALAQLTRELAVRLAKQGVQVNCIAFGGVEGRVDEGFKKRYADLTPMGRMLREDEIAGPVDMLLSKNASAMTGQVIAVDGGWTIW